MRTCAHNPKRPDIYGDRAEFEAAQRARRARMLREYLAALPDDATRELALKSCAAELRDLGLDIE